MVYSQPPSGQNRYISQFDRDPSKGPPGGNFQMNTNPQFQRGRQDNFKMTPQSNLVANEQKSQPTTPNPNQMQNIPQRGVPPTSQYNQPVQPQMDYNKAREMPMNPNINEVMANMPKNLPPQGGNMQGNNMSMMQNKPIATPMNNANVPPSMPTGYQNQPQSISPQNQPNPAMMPNQKMPFMHNNSNYYDRQNAQNYANQTMYPEDMSSNYINQNMGSQNMPGYMGGNQNMFMRQQQQQPMQNQQNFPQMQPQTSNFYPGQVNPNTYNQINMPGYQMQQGYAAGTNQTINNQNNNKPPINLTQPQAIQMTSAMSNEDKRMLMEKLKNLSWRDRTAETGHQQQPQQTSIFFFNFLTSLII